MPEKKHTVKVQAHGEQPFSGSDWVYSRKVFNEATSATHLARVMYSFLLPFFPTRFLGGVFDKACTQAQILMWVNLKIRGAQISKQGVCWLECQIVS